MKQTIKKILIIFCAVFLAVFTTVAYPMQQAQAGPLVGGVVPGGITIGAGTYALGALGLAGIAGLAGYEEYQDEINAHAKGVWQGGTQAAMDSLNVSINAAKGVGNGIVNLQGDFINFMEGKLDYIAANSVAYKYGPENALETGTGFRIGLLNTGSQLNTETGYIIQSFKGGVMSKETVMMVNASPSEYIQITYGSSSAKPPWSLFGIKTFEEAKAFARSIRSVAQFNHLFQAHHTRSIEIVAVATGAAVNSSNADYAAARSKVREAWEGMRDAGLVLPVDSALPLSSVDGSPLTYNPTADNYTGIDGGVYTGTPDWAFPQPKIRVANPDIPNSVPTTGVYVDTPVLTGNPAYDDTIINNPAIPKTTTNVQTGVTVGNPDIAVPTTPPVTIPGTVPPIVPPFDAPGTTGLDFTPLMMTGTAMTEKFPFSIPFDFVKQLQILNVEPEAPSFNIDVPKFLEIGGFTIPFKFKLSFEMFDPIANIIRWGLVIIFDISLIFAIRKLLPE